MSMKKTMMYLPDDMHRFLANEADERGVSMAHIAREAIAEYRSVREAERPVRVSALFGVIDDSETADDLALSVDATLAEHYAEEGLWEQENGLADTR